MKRRFWWMLSVWLLFTCVGFAISEARAAVLPYFRYCNVMSSNTPSGVSTVLSAEVFYPNPEASAITSVSVLGPGGFTATMTTSDYDPSANLFKKEISGQPTAGEYKFTVVDTLGGSAVSYYRLGSVTILPMVDSTTFVAYGEPLTPTLCWSDVSGYNGNLLFIAVILDSNDDVVWVSADPTTLPGGPTGLTNVTVPPGKLSSGGSYRWRVIAVDNKDYEVVDNQSKSAKVPLTIGAAHTGFLYARVYTLTRPTSAVSVLDARLVLPDSPSENNISSFVVTGPKGFSYSFQPSDFRSGNNFYHESPAFFPSGMYTFTVVVGTGETAVTSRSYHHFVNAPVPLVDESSLQASGNALTPRLTWAAPKEPGRSFFYSANITNTTNRVYVGPSSGPTLVVPANTLQTGGSYRWRVDVTDTRWPYQPNNVSQADEVDLTLDNSRPNFLYGAAVFNRHDPDGVFTALDAYVNDPDGSGLDISTMSLEVKGPDGFKYQLLQENLQVAPVFSPDDREYYFRSEILLDGMYLFNLSYNSGADEIETSDSLYNGSQTIPLPDEDSFQVSGDPLAPTVSWGGISGYSNHLYYRLRVFDPNGVTVYSSQREPYSSQTVETGILQAGESYMYRVEAQDDPAWTVYNNRSNSHKLPLDLAANTKPGAPANVTATPGDTQATVSFDVPASNGSVITSYTATSIPDGITGTGSTNQIIVSGLTNGKPYTFKVTATNSVGTGPESAASNSVTPFGKPGAPTNVTATPGDTQATVSFDAPATNGNAIKTYTVTSIPGGITASGTATTIPVTGLTNGTPYTFKVTATNDAGTGAESGPSNSVTPFGKPGAPSNVTATPGDTQATVSFDAPATNGNAIKTYTVTSTPGGITASGTATTIPVTGLTNGTPYTFKVAATNDAGTGSESAPSNSITPYGKPGAPTNVTATPGDTQATVSFGAPASNNGSNIQTYTVTSNPGGKTASGNLTTLTVNELTNGTAYTFTVTAANAAGTGAASSPSNSVTPFGKPGAPTNVTAIPGDTQATVNFGAPASNNGSNIQTYTVTSNPGGKTASGNLTTLTVNELTNGTAYTFTVTAANAAGTGAESGPSNSVTPFGKPGAPTNVTATPGDTQASVSFGAPASNNGSNIQTYTVTSNPGGKTASGNLTTLTVNELTNGTSYTFTVTAANAAGTGPASVPSLAVTPVHHVTGNPPGAPTSVKATAKNGKATVAFTAPKSKGDSAIQTYSATSNPGGKTATGTRSGITVDGLTNGTAYTFTVTAANASGSGPASAPSARVTPVGLPDSPTGVTASIGTTGATVSFTPPASNGGKPITSYTVTASPGGKKVTKNSSSTSITVPGLKIGTQYTFTVTAKTSAGTSPPSSASNSVIIVGVPGAPGKPTATAGNAQATVSFAAAADNGSSITSYTVTSKPGGIKVTQNSTSIIVPGLTNGTSYTFTVTATNGVGTGKASSASNKVKPK